MWFPKELTHPNPPKVNPMYTFSHLSLLTITIIDSSSQINFLLLKQYLVLNNNKRGQLCMFRSWPRRSEAIDDTIPGETFRPTVFVDTVSCCILGTAIARICQLAISPVCPRVLLFRLILSKVVSSASSSGSVRPSTAFPQRQGGMAKKPYSS